MTDHIEPRVRAGAHRPLRQGGVRTGFRGDLEGLRAVAVLVVVWYHAGLPWLGGGFIGVDVFFTLSGFFITGLLWRGWQRSGRMGLGAFYARRIRRLLPMAGLVLIVTTLISAWALPPLQVRSVLIDARWTALYAVNMRFAIQGTDYLAASAPPSPLQHYWSLAVEEQFYLLWPVLLVAVIWWATRRSTDTPVDHRRTTWLAAGALSAVTVASFLISLRWTRTVPPWAFFSLPTRAWELAVGGLLALSSPTLARLGRAAIPLGWCGLALILAACHWISADTPYPGLAALAPVAGSAAIIVAGHYSQRAGVGSLLGRAPLRAVGRMSYSWYLWHWPLFILAPAVLDRPLGLVDRLGLVLLSGGLAAISFVLVEDPLRHSVRLRIPQRAFTFALAVTVTAVAVTGIVSRQLPSLRGTGAAAQQVAIVGPPTAATSPSGKVSKPVRPAGSTGTTAASGPTGATASGSVRTSTAAPAKHPSAPADLEPPAVRSEQQQAQTLVNAALSLQQVPSNLTPAVDQADSDLAPPFYNGCLLTWTATEQPDCDSAETSAQQSIVLFGDSHAAQWYPALHAMAESRHWELRTYTKSVCPPFLLPTFSPYLGREYTECENWRQEVLGLIRRQPPALVVLGVARHYGPQAHFLPYDPGWLSGMSKMIRELRATKTKVLLMGAIPKPPADVPGCLSAHMDAVQSCDFSKADTVNKAGIAKEELTATKAGAAYLNLIPFMCGSSRCPVIIGTDLVYRDDNHLATGFAGLMEPVIASEIDAVLAGP